VDARVLGIVLNAVNLGRFEYSYYHYGYYRKGAGYGTDSPSSSTPVDQPSAPQ
jgi:hypothetical protein